ncbi:MAG: hypothetical protein KC516_00990 [Nanoarchaeota archaeon]|nr:hypothetical protein [Nanoarchaeota archaeon]
MKNKKGTHVGIILSFVIFIGFLVFAAYSLKIPTKTEDIKLNSLESMKINVLNEVSLETSSIFIEELSSASCGVFTEENYGIEPMNFSVKNSEGQFVASYRESLSGRVYFEKNIEPGFYKIIYSSRKLNYMQASDELDSCEEVNVETVLTKKQVVEEKIIEMIQEYQNDYVSLKSRLNVAPDNEFGVQFSYSNGTTIGQSPDDKRTDIFIKKFQVVYLNENAEKETGDFTISIW